MVLREYGKDYIVKTSS